MRAEIAIEIVDDIIDDFKTLEISAKFQSLVSALENQSASSTPDTQGSVKQASDALLDALDASRLNNYPVSLQLPLEEMEINDYLPRRLKQDLINSLTGSDLTPAVALEAVLKIQEKAERLLTNAKNLSESAEFFEIYSDIPNDDEFDFTISIPRAAVSNELDDFGRELVRLDKLMGVFSELSTGSRQDFTIKAITSTDLTVILHSLPAVAVMIATALERITAIYEKMLNIVNLHKQMKSSSLPENVLKDMEKFIAKTLKDEIETAAREIESKFIRKVDTGRRNELKNELRNCLRELASRFDRGYIFDIRGSEQEPAEMEGTEVAEDTPAGRRRIVHEKRERLKFFRVEDKPILGLPKPENDNGSEDV